MKACSGRTTGRLVGLTLLLSSAAFSQSGPTGLLTPDEVAARLRQFAPAAITADTAALSKGDRGALRHVLEAGRILERVYLRQSTPGGDTLPESLALDTSAEGKARLRLFLQTMSPWSGPDMHRSIIPGVPTRRPPQANFYPPTMMRSGWSSWFIGLDPARQAEATDPVHVVHRDSATGFVTVPYSTEYADLLAPAAAHLDSAARTAADAGLRKYLTALAAAFRSNDYSSVEAAQLETGGALEVVAGPTSSILDNFFGYKKAYEAVVAIRSREGAARLAAMEKALPRTAAALGVSRPPANAPAPGKRRDVVVADAAFIGGAARSGSTTSTLRLPVDPALRDSQGSRSVILRNVHEALFRTVTQSVAKAMLDPSDARSVGFDAHLSWLLMRELAPRLAPAPSGSAGGEREDTDPRVILADVRDDVVALAATESMARAGTIGNVTPEAALATRIVAILRALRFWGDDPAAYNAAVEFNFYREGGGIRYDPAGGVVRIDFGKLREAVRALVAACSAPIETNDAAGASTLLARYAVQPPELRGLREQLSPIPVDIEPRFPLAR